MTGALGKAKLKISLPQPVQGARYGRGAWGAGSSPRSAGFCSTQPLGALRWVLALQEGSSAVPSAVAVPAPSHARGHGQHNGSPAQGRPGTSGTPGAASRLPKRGRGSVSLRGTAGLAHGPHAEVPGGACQKRCLLSQRAFSPPLKQGLFRQHASS